MTSTAISRLTLLAAIAGLAAVGAVSADGAGKSIFVENKCSTCHAISAAGIARTGAATAKTPPDLSTVGTRRTAAFIVKFLKKEEAIEGRKHVLKFKGSDEQLGTLAAWLVGLKAG
jgi:mono/diheme cytochrome c family protein